MSAVGAYGEAEYIGFKLEYAAATAAAGSAIYSTGAGGVTCENFFFRMSHKVPETKIHLFLSYLS